MTEKGEKYTFTEKLELYGESYDVRTVNAVIETASNLANRTTDAEWVQQNPHEAHAYLYEDDCMYYFLGDSAPDEESVLFMYWRNGAFTERWCTKNAPWTDKCRAVRKIPFRRAVSLPAPTGVLPPLETP